MCLVTNIRRFSDLHVSSITSIIGGEHNITLTAQDLEVVINQRTVDIKMSTPSPTATVSNTPEMIGLIPEHHFEPNVEPSLADFDEWYIHLPN